MCFFNVNYAGMHESISLANVFILLTPMIMYGYAMFATGNRMEDQLLHYVMCVSLMSIMQACTNLFHLPMYLYY